MLIVLLILLVFAASAGGAQKGVSVDLSWGASAADQDREGLLLADSGSQWVRLTAGQADQNLDRPIAVAEAAGQKILVAVGDTTPDAPAAYADLVRSLATRYRGRVDAWEVWNEENIERFWPSPSPAAYTELLRAAYPAIKAGDPGALVVFGGVAGNDTAFIEGAYAAGAGDSFDVMAVHPYGGTAPEVDAGQYSFAGYRAVRDLMQRRGDTRPLWFTEFGWATTTQPPWGVDAATQADWLTRAYALIAQDPAVQVALWYNFRNNFWARDADTWEDQLGLLKSTFEPKPAYAAFKAVMPSEPTPAPSPSEPATSPSVPATSPSKRQSRTVLYLRRGILRGRVYPRTTGIVRVRIGRCVYRRALRAGGFTAGRLAPGRRARARFLGNARTLPSLSRVVTAP